MVCCDEGDGGMVKEAGKEGGEVPGGSGGERVKGVENKKEFWKGQFFLSLLFLVANREIKHR